MNRRGIKLQFSAINTAIYVHNATNSFPNMMNITRTLTNLFLLLMDYEYLYILEYFENNNASSTIVLKRNENYSSNIRAINTTIVTRLQIIR